MRHWKQTFFFFSNLHSIRVIYIKTCLHSPDSINWIYNFTIELCTGEHDKMKMFGRERNSNKAQSLLIEHDKYKEITAEKNKKYKKTFHTNRLQLAIVMHTMSKALFSTECYTVCIHQAGCKSIIKLLVRAKSQMGWTVQPPTGSKALDLINL